MIVIVVVLVVIALVAYFIRDIFVVCQHLATKWTNQRNVERNVENQGGGRTAETHPIQDQARLERQNSVQSQGGPQAL